jgi:hypothetical protein
MDFSFQPFLCVNVNLSYLALSDGNVWNEGQTGVIYEFLE